MLSDKNVITSHFYKDRMMKQYILSLYCRCPHGQRGLKLLLRELLAEADKSLPAWAAWIEIVSSVHDEVVMMSLPAWAAWIEIPQPHTYLFPKVSLPAWAAWIEIIVQLNADNIGTGRCPHGQRGLKCQMLL